MAGAGSRLAAATLLLGAVGLLACPAQTGAPPPGPQPSPGSASSRSAAAEPATAAVPVETGFIPCCGSARYRMEIDCADMLKRCYEYQRGSWRQTFGRHCKEQLGDACYLEHCEAKCQ